jgi:DNA-binding MarR family transcriptional regulator
VTRRGKAVVDQAIETHLESQRGLFDALTAQERRQLNGLLRKVLAQLET